MSENVLNQKIPVTQQAKTHPLFPMLDFLVRSTYSIHNQLDDIKKRLKAVEDNGTVANRVQKELEQLIREFGESTFEIEKTPYQVS